MRIRNLRQTGTVVAFEVEVSDEGYTSDLKEIFTKKSLERGVYLRPLGNTVYIMPPYCITDEELSRVYEVIVEVLEGLDHTL